jgi:hypothetical protein
MKGNQMTTQEPVHVATIQWGTLYTGEDVNKLFSMVKKKYFGSCLLSPL